MATPDLGSRSERPLLRASLVPRVTLRAAECGRDVRSATSRLSTPTRRVAPHGVLLFLPTARRGLGHGRPVSAPRPGTGMPRGVAMGGVTPRQACPRPSGLGRNLRSKTRWFTGFCNSHQVSHFATFFIDARAEISVAESRLKDSQTGGGSPRRCRIPCRGAPAPGEAAALSASIPWRSPRPEGCYERSSGRAPPGRPRGRAPRAAFPRDWFAGGGSRDGNDPSAGSPTETLLRLLLPLNDKVQWTSRDVAGGEPPTSPRSEHFTGPFNR